MTKISETIIFFGSGPVAAKSLELLLESFNIEAVITKPAKTRKNDPVPVINVAKKHNLKMYLPSDRSELDTLIESTNINSKMAVLIDYGIIVSKKVINYFPMGILNSHFSLLPKWRGADPITFSLLDDENKTGVSLMLLSEGMDEGELIGQSTLTINPDDDSSTLTDQLIYLSNDLILSHLPEYINGKLKPVPQNIELGITYSRKLTKSDGLIDWKKPAKTIEKEIRAFSSWPKSYTTISGKDLIITKAHVVHETGLPGDYRVDRSEFVVYCGKYALSIDKLKPSGKKEMDIVSFIAGYGSIFK